MKKYILLLLFVFTIAEVNAQCGGCTTTINTASAAPQALAAGQTLCIVSGGNYTGNITAFPAGSIICVSGTGIFTPAAMPAASAGTLIISPNCSGISTLPARVYTAGFTIQNQATAGGMLNIGASTLIAGQNNSTSVGATTSYTGLVTIQGGTYSNAGTTNFTAGATVTGATTAITNSNNLNFNGATSLNAGAFTNSGTTIFSLAAPATIGNVTTERIVNTGTLTFSGTSSFAFGSTLSNTGTVNFVGAMTYAGGATVPSATITNNIGGVINYSANNTLATTGSAIYNYGNIAFTANFTTNAQTNIYNYGYITIGGTLSSTASFKNYGKLTVTGAATFNANVAALNYNYCTIIVNGNLTNNCAKTRNLGYVFVNTAGTTFSNSATGRYYQDANGVTVGVNFTNVAGGQVTGKGNYYFTGVTTNNGPFGNDALGINFYDTGLPATIMDVQGTVPHISVTKTAFVAPVSTDMVTACIIAANIPPTANDDYYITSSGVVVGGNVLTNDIDPNFGDITRVMGTLIGAPQHAAAFVYNPDGSFTYTSTPGYVGYDMFTYIVCDNGIPNKCDTATATITVNGNIAVNPTCGTPGKDGAGSISAIPNTFWPGTANANAGQKNITLGGYNAAGSNTPIAAGDMVMIIQIQGADINTNAATVNSDAYGDGIVGYDGSGYLYNANLTAGYLEYGIATNAIPAGAGPYTLTLADNLLNSYVNSNYVAGVSGQRRFQVIRVPQYASLILTANIVVPAWNGTTGGIFSVTVAGAMNFNSFTIDAKGKGFRGGGGRSIGGVGTGANTDFVTLNANNTNGQKGEGVAGTPQYVNNGGVLLNTGVEGYPLGSSAQGAPGNAGGGGTDGTNNNDENSGGGGGANGGSGGKGGNTWNTALPIGGEPGAYFIPISPKRIIFGGGGGAGSSNNATGVPGAGFASSGAAGGGIVAIYAKSLTANPGTIDVSGADANNTVGNDASGGGGGGGSALIVSNTALTSITILAKGGNGGTNTGGGVPHGPGGGGGGGGVYSNTNLNAASTVSSGLSGTTCVNTPTIFGSSNGKSGKIQSAVSQWDLPPGFMGCYNSIIAANDNNATLINMPVSGSVITNDLDVEGNAISFTGFYDSTSTSYLTAGTITLSGLNLSGAYVANAGSLLINATGAYTFTPTAGFTGTAKVVYRITDNYSLPAFSNALLAIQVGVKDLCLANDLIPTSDQLLTFMSTPLSGNVLTNDRDPESEGLVFGGIQNPLNPLSFVTNGTITNLPGIDIYGNAFANAGSISILPSGNYTFTPSTNTNFAGYVTLVYLVCDIHAPSLCKLSVLKIDVSPVPSGTTNKNPFAQDNFGYTSMNVTLAGSSLLLNAMDADAGIISINTTPVVSPAHGALTINAAGTYSFIPTAGYFGPDKFVYQICDNGTPSKCHTATCYILVNPKPSTANAGPDQTGASTCGLTTVTLAGSLLGTGETGAWTITAGVGGTATTPTSPTSTFTGVAGSSYTLRWTITSGGCSTFDDVIITFNQNPTTANAGTDQTGAATCGLTTVTLAGNTPAVGTGAWTITVGAGGTLTTPTSPTSTFTGVAGTAYTLRWTISNAPCAASFDDVNVTFNVAPTTANAGADQTGAATCGLTTVTLAGNTPALGTGAWTITAGAGGTVTTPTSPTSTFTGVAGTAYTLRWTISNAPCAASFDDVNVTFNRNPTVANAGADQTGAATCGLTTVTLGGNTPVVGTGAWTITVGVGGTVTTPTSPTSTFSGVAGTAYTLRWTISNAPCAASFDDVNVTFNRNPTVANAGVDQTGAATCGLTTVTLGGNTPVVGTGAWTITVGVGGTVTTPTSPTSTFTGVAGTAYTLRWTISNAPCAASFDDVNVTFNRNPTVANAGVDQTGAATCGLTTITLAGNTPAVGTGAWTITAGAGGTVTTPTSPTSTFTGVAGTTYILRWTISNAPCIASFDDVNVTFNRNPTVANAGADQTGVATCGLTTVTLGGNTPVVGTGAWTITAGVGGTVTTSTSPTSTFTGVAGTTYTLRWTISNAPCAASFDDVNVTFNISPTSANAGADQNICAVSSTTLSANTPVVGTGVWSQVSGPNAATFTLASNPGTTVTGLITGTYVFRWTTTNGPCTTTDNVSITLGNCPPVANDDNGAAINEDGPNGTVNVLTNDTDPDGNPTAPVNGVGQFTIDLDPGTAGIQTTYTDAQGVWTLNTATGVVTFDPTNNYNGTAVATYTLCDPSGACDNATITFVVTPVNDPPLANDDNGAALTEDGPNGTVNVLTNDTDPDGNPTAPVNGVGQFTIDLDPGTAGIQTTYTDAQGVWTLNTATGVVTFNPANNYNGTAVATYTLCDPSGACDNATITFVVTPVNDPPVANDDNGAALTEDGPNGTVNVLTNDTDPDGNPTAPVNGVGQFTVDLDPGTAGIQSIYTDAQGAWTLNTATGVVTFDPANNYNGTAVSTYTLCDPSGACDNATITFVVTPVNDPPVANDDNGAALTEDGPNGTVNVLTNDTDPDGNPTAPVNGVGQFTVDLDPGTAGIQTTYTDAQGVWTLNTATGVVTFNPANNYNGTAVATYTLCDPSGACDNATITFVVTPVNDPPVANDDNGAALTEDGPNGTVNVLTNDTDPDGNPTAPVNGVGQFTVDLDPGTAGIQTIYTDAQGAWTLNTATGVVTFDPANNYNGTAVSTYTLCDPSGACDNAIITFVVTPVNDPPIVDNELLTTPEDTPVSGDLTDAGDFDVDGNIVVTIVPIDGPTIGGLVINPDGTFTYTPNTDFNGTDTAVVQICDDGTPLPALCVNDTIFITVTPVNDVPVINDTIVTTPEDIPITVCVLFTDVDGVAPYTVTLSCNDNGAATYAIVGNTVCVTYTPDLNYNGQDTVCVTLCDAGGLCTTGEIFITVTPVNDPPVVDNEILTTPEDTPVSGDLTDAGDFDVDGNIVVTIVPIDGPTNGGLIINPDGTYTYTPNTDFNGTDTAVVQICDDGTPLPALCVNDTIFITVTPVNDVPVINDTIVTTPEDIPITVCVPFTDVDGVAPYTVTLSCNDNGAATYAIVGNTVCVTYTPDLNYNGQDTVCVTLCDAGGLCTTGEIFITVTPVNDPPVVDNEILTTPEDTPVSGDLTDAGDFDVDGNLVVTIVPIDGPTNGGLVINPDGTFTYTPNTDFNGTDTAVVQICDDGTPLPALCVNDTIFITVTPVNDVPVINDTIVTTPEDIPITVCVPFTDTDGVAPYTVTLSCNDNGTATYAIVGNTVCVTYTPDLNYNGQDTVCVTLCDAGGLCTTGEIFITVTPVNDPPLVDNEILTTPEDTPVSGDLTDAGDFDVDGNLVVTIVPIDGPTNGGLVINPDGTFTYTPNTDFNGTDTAVVQICDDGTPLPALCVNDTIFITVTPVNDVPVINDTIVTTPEDIPITVCVPFIDADGVAPYTVTLSCNDNGAATYAVVGNTVCLTYTPDLNYNGQDTVCVTLCDAGGLCATGDIFITVTPANDPPVTVNEYETIPEDTPLSGTILTSADTDSEGNNLTVVTTPLAGPDNGSIIMNPDGTYTYTPNNNYVGSDMVVFQICDDGIPQQCAFDTLFIIVTPINDPPIAGDDVAGTNPGVPVNINIGLNDSDVDGPVLTWSIIQSPDSGTVVIVGNIITYTPNPGVGTTGQVIDTLYYTICDNGTPDLCDTAMVVIYIPNSPLPPIVTNEYVVGIEDQPLIINVLGNDYDPNQDTLSFTPGSGTTLNGTWVVDVNNNIIYQPNPNFNGNDTIIVQICDQTTPTPFCINDTIFIIITPVNDPPIVTNDFVSTLVNVPVSGDLTGVGEYDPDGTTLTTNITQVSGPSNGNIVINNDGTFTYTPSIGFIGLDTVVVEVCDNGIPQPSICVFDTLFITVISSLPPTIPDTLVTTPQDSTITFCLDITDPENNSPFTISNIDCADLGNVSAIINGNQVCITYIPSLGVIGLDTLCITICDATNSCVTTNPVVNIVPNVNTPPLVNDTLVYTPMDSTITVCVPIVDAEGNGPYTAIIGCADNGTSSAVVVGNTVCVTFVPALGYIGTDSLCLVVCDAANSCDTSNVVIVVTPPNTPPLVNDTLVYTQMDSTITVCVPIVDAEGNGPYTATIGCADNGTASAIVTGNTVCITFVPNAGYVGTDSLCLILCDAANACDSSNIVIVVTPPNTPPLVNDTLVYTPMDSAITVCVPIVDVQGNGPYTATIGCANNGTTSAVVTGNTVCITFVPNAGYIGTDSLCLVICDGAGLCDTSNIIVVVTPPGNLPPVAVPDYATTKIATPVTIPVIFNDYDTDGTINIASVVIIQNPLHGTVQTFIDGTNIYTPYAGYVGIDHYIYRIWDNDVIPLNDTALVTIVIEPNKLSVPNGFSPDGDGVNETFVIQGLEAYPDAGLQIYNRWGNLVYEKVPYDNKWEGTSNVGGVLFGSNLPEGTYFYMLDLNNDEKPMSGYVILKR